MYNCSSIHLHITIVTELGKSALEKLEFTIIADSRMQINTNITLK